MVGLTMALAAALCILGHAKADTASPGVRVVLVELCVAEQEPERVEAAFTTPIEKLLLGLPGVETINSNTGMGGLALEIHFIGGATDDDAASVNLALDRSAPLVLGRTVRLNSPSPDQGFRGRPCESVLSRR